MPDVSPFSVVLVEVVVGVVLEVGVVFFFLQFAGSLYLVLYLDLYHQVGAGVGE
jgi:hypothetical protein